MLHGGSALLSARDPSEVTHIWSTVRLPLEELGLESARLLLKRIRGEVPVEMVVALPVELVARGTCCAPFCKGS